MRIFILSNDYLGFKISSFLTKKKENIVGVAVDNKNSYFSKKTLKLLKTKNKLVFKKRISKKNIELIKKLKPDVILVIYWRYILNEILFKIPRCGCLNFHMGYLPFNRGKNPNVWPIIEGTPAGCTIHKIDKGIDSGGIICQKKTKFNYLDTGQTLYNKILNDFENLFYKNWNKMKKNKFKASKQNLKKGNFHLSKDFEKISEIDLNKKYYPLDLINILRAKTFKPHKPAYFKLKNRKYFIDIKLSKNSFSK